MLVEPAEEGGRATGVLNLLRGTRQIIRSYVELTRPPHGLQLKPIIELGLENLERYALRFRHRQARIDRTAFLRERPVYTGVDGTVEHVDATKLVQEQPESATGARHGEGVLSSV